MRVFGLALGVLFAVTVSVARASQRVAVQYGASECGSGAGCCAGLGHAAARAGAQGLSAAKEQPGILANGTANGSHRIGRRALIMAGGVLMVGPGPTYWVYVPESAVFDYPFADWRGPMDGWDNP
jgi:hypothetical protein